MTREIWKPIPTSKGCYAASNLGRVRSIPAIGSRRTGKVLSAQQESDGRYRVSLHLPWIGKWGLKRFLVHKLVMEAFKGKCPAGYEVNHKDGDHTNNVLNNLEYIPKRKNYDHAVQHRLYAHSEKRGASKLTTDSVRLIRKSELAAKVLAEIYGVSATAISAVRKRKIWKYVD